MCIRDRVRLAKFDAGAAQADVKVLAQLEVVDRALEDAVAVVIRQEGEAVAGRTQCRQRLRHAGAEHPGGHFRRVEDIDGFVQDVGVHAAGRVANELQ